jgi:nucleotide-binding universal stress UspA family protein
MATIVLGYDGTEPAQRALAVAATIAGGETITVVSVVHPLPGGKSGPAYDPIEREDHERHLREARDRLAELGAKCSLVEGFGDPARVVVDVARKAGARIIVLGRGDRSFLERLLHHSVSAGVARRARTAVLVVP